MPPIIPDYIPSVFVAGTTVKFTRQLADFPPGQGWNYTIYFNGANSIFNKAGVAQADGSFLVTIDPADTASITPGAYRYAERVTNGSEVYDVVGDELIVTVEPNLATAPAGAFLTHAEKTLSVIEAALSGRLTADLESYQIAGRAVTKIPIKELRELRGWYAAEVARAQNPGTLGTPIFQVQFDVESEREYPPTWVDVTGFER
jgi:hypothetical protein